MPSLNAHLSATAALGLLVFGGCTAVPATSEAVTASAQPVIAAPVETTATVETVEADAAKYEADRAAILAMAGDYKVSFDFTETVSFVDGYEVKEPKLSGGHEIVRVLEDTGDFISLQHVLVVGGEQKFPVKHWRQDWQYEPEQVLVFIGGNAWEWRDVPEDERAGTWSQTVYQVDDAPRYGAVAEWTHEDGISEWAPPAEWRPLPRRDMTTRSDYHAIDAVNRHAITPWGWVHEQDNSKLILSGAPQVLVREIGVNTYRRYDDFPVDIGTDYLAGTEEFWKAVRAEWRGIEESHDRFAITIKGETEALYLPLLGLAEAYKAGEMDLDTAIADAQDVIASFVTDDIGTLASRLRPGVQMAEAPGDS